MITRSVVTAVRGAVTSALQNGLQGSYDSPYEPEAAALFARMDVEPDATRKGHINTFYAALKTDDVLSELDVLYLLAAHDTQAAKLNLISSSYNLAAPGTSPTFTTDRGFTGVPASSTTLVASGYNPSTAGGNFTVNDACAGIWTRTAASYDGTTSRIDLFMGTGTVRMQRRNSDAAQYAYRMNDGTSRNVILSGGASEQAGHFTVMRTAADARALYRSGSSIDTNTQASNAVSQTFALFGTAGSYSDAQIIAAYAGGSLSGTKLTALHNALDTYATAVGAV